MARVDFTERVVRRVLRYLREFSRYEGYRTFVCPRGVIYQPDCVILWSGKIDLMRWGFLPVSPDQKTRLLKALGWVRKTKAYQMAKDSDAKGGKEHRSVWPD